MAIYKIKAKKVTCDGCGGVQLFEDDDEPILGLHGTVTWHHVMGGHGAEWYACAPDCVGPAVNNALDKANGHG